MTEINTNRPDEFDMKLAKYLVDPGPGPRFESPHAMSDGPLNGESDGEWTDRLIRTGMSLGLYRQCSIGYHEECSNRYAGPEATCLCSCHAEQPQASI